MKKYLLATTIVLSFMIFLTRNVKAQNLDVSPSFKYLMTTSPSLFDLGMVRLNMLLPEISQNIKDKNEKIKKLSTFAGFDSKKNIIQLEFTVFLPLEKDAQSLTKKECQHDLDEIEESLFTESFVPQLSGLSDDYNPDTVHLPARLRVTKYFGNVFGHVDYHFQNEPKDLNENIVNKIRIKVDIYDLSKSPYPVSGADNVCEVALMDINWEDFDKSIFPTMKK